MALSVDLDLAMKKKMPHSMRKFQGDHLHKLTGSKDDEGDTHHGRWTDASMAVYESAGVTMLEREDNQLKKISTVLAGTHGKVVHQERKATNNAGPSQTKTSVTVDLTV